MENISKDLIFNKAFELAVKESSTLIDSQTFKKVIFYYYHFCVCLNIEVTIDDKHLQAMYSGKLTDDFGTIQHE